MSYVLPSQSALSFLSVEREIWAYMFTRWTKTSRPKPLSFLQKMLLRIQIFQACCRNEAPLKWFFFTHKYQIWLKNSNGTRVISLEASPLHWFRQFKNMSRNVNNVTQQKAIFKVTSDTMPIISRIVIVFGFFCNFFHLKQFDMRKFKCLTHWIIMVLRGRNTTAATKAKTIGLRELKIL